MVLQFIILGIVNSGVYALIAVGLSLLFGVVRVINVAQGEWLTFGGYMAVVLLGTLGMNSFLGIVGAGVATALLALLVYFLFVAPLRKRMGARSPGSTYLVLTLGISMLLQNSYILIASPNFRRVPVFVKGVSNLAGLLITNQRLAVFGIATLLLILFFLFLRYAKIGMAIRAVAQNPTAALCSGISVHAALATAFVISGICAGVGGVLIGSTLRIYPTFGFELLLKGFAVTVVGGLGNLAGALIAAYMIGITEALAVMLLPSEWKAAVAFTLMIVVLILRPQGLFGQRGRL